MERTERHEGLRFGREHGHRARPMGRGGFRGGHGPGAPYGAGGGPIGGHGGGPHGPRPPFDGFPGGLFGRGRKTNRGDIRAAVLSLLGEQPLHGYQIIQEIIERTEGAWQPSAGSIYPMLHQLTDEGLVQAEKTGGRQVFHLTEAGQQYAEERQAELAAVWEAASDPAGGRSREMGELIKQIIIAAMQVKQTGTEAQFAAARKVLADTRRQIYRILAEDDLSPEE
jgi:DNA-binding PadR family transcriptional regulator